MMRYQIATNDHVMNIRQVINVLYQPAGFNEVHSRREGNLSRNAKNK